MSRAESRLALIGLFALGCGGSPTTTAPTDVLLVAATAAPSASNSRDPSIPISPKRGPSVIEIVGKLLGSQIWAVVDVSAFKNHPFADRIEPVLPYAYSLSQAGIKPRSDFDRILLADLSLSHHHNPVAVYEHHIDQARVDAFLNFAVEESVPRGRRAVVDDHPCAFLFRKGLIGSACVVTSTLLVVTTEPEVDLMRALLTSSGIPAPPPGEAVHATFVDPSRSMEIGGFHPPDTLAQMDLSVVLSRQGGLTMTAVSPSDDPTRDVIALMQIWNATSGSAHLGPLPITMPPVRTEARDGKVTLELTIDQQDLDAMMTLVELALPF